MTRPRPQNNKLVLAFRELEALAGAFLSVLLALVLPGVTRQQAGLFQEGAKFRVVGDQSAGNAETHCAGLTRDSAAIGEHQNVETITLLGRYQRELCRDTARFGGEVVLKRTAIDRDLARTGAQENSGDASLATAGAQILFNFL